MPDVTPCHAWPPQGERARKRKKQPSESWRREAIATFSLSGSEAGGWTVYIYIYIYMYTYVCMYIYIYICVYMYMSWVADLRVGRSQLPCVYMTHVRVLLSFQQATFQTNTHDNRKTCSYCFVSIEIMRCRLLEWMLDRPMNNADSLPSVYDRLIDWWKSCVTCTAWMTDGWWVGLSHTNRKEAMFHTNHADKRSYVSHWSCRVYHMTVMQIISHYCPTILLSYHAHYHIILLWCRLYHTSHADYPLPLDRREFPSCGAPSRLRRLGAYVYVYIYIYIYIICIYVCIYIYIYIYIERERERERDDTRL